MSNLPILIVEDEAIIAHDLAYKIKQLGHDVAGITSSGEEAIEFVHRHQLSLVLMDIQLAGAMDGIEAAQQIHYKYKLPILFLTANADPSTKERMRQAGSAGYIMKPYDNRDISIQIKNALNNFSAK